MSVIVKGMEIPKDCYDCPLHDGETGRCNILRITVLDYIPKECPLVEVVRCKNCKYAEFIDDRITCDYTTEWLDPNGYCNMGERNNDNRRYDSVNYAVCKR